MRRFWWLFAVTALVTMLACCYGGILLSQSVGVPPSVPATFSEKDLVGTWQATYGTPKTKDTITLRADGTYQQIFQSPESNYFYESPWNKWYIEYTSDGKPKLHLEGMRYCVTLIYLCEATGHGKPQLYYDFIERGVVKLTNEVILRITGDEKSPRGIRLWQLQIDEDDGPEPFVFVDE